MISPLVRPDRRRRGSPARWIGGRCGRSRATQLGPQPGRTAATTAALMIGVALVAFVATLANGCKARTARRSRIGSPANFIITSQDGYTPFVAAAGDAAADAPSARRSTASPQLAEIAGHGGYLTGIDPS